MKLLNIIAACAENRAIGRDGKLPWHIPEDMQFLRTQTAGQICISGRVSYLAWPGTAREGRRPIVVTSRGVAAHEGHAPAIVRSFDAALGLAETCPGEIYICGGQRIFEEALLLARPTRLFLTLIHAEVPGDRFFPEWRHLPWRELARRESGDANYRYTFLTLEK